MTSRVLLVDDEPKVLRALQRVLAEEPGAWEVATAESVDDALAQTRLTAFDVIVTDVNMPGRDGFSLLHEIRHTPRTECIPVLIVTGRDDEDLKRRALEQGAVDLLSKPVHPLDLLARLRSSVRLKMYEDPLRTQNQLLEQRVAERTIELENSRREIIWKLGKAGEHRDEETGNHVVRVGCYCRVMARTLGMDEDFVETLFLASPLHDIGKIGIPDSVLRKRGPLTCDEWEIMKQHCVIGAEILRDSSKSMQIYEAIAAARRPGPVRETVNPVMDMAAGIALMHHERWDGSGYPSGLSRDEIPLPARIVALADTYDALRSERPYKAAVSIEETFELIIREAGKHFDPALCEAFRGLQPDFDAIHEALSDWPSPMLDLEYSP